MDQLSGTAGPGARVALEALNNRLARGEAPALRVRTPCQVSASGGTTSSEVSRIYVSMPRGSRMSNRLSLPNAMVAGQVPSGPGAYGTRFSTLLLLGGKSSTLSPLLAIP